jgi:hypothetical protein
MYNFVPALIPFPFHIFLHLWAFFDRWEKSGSLGMLFFSAVGDMASIMKARHKKNKLHQIDSHYRPSYGNFLCRKAKTFDDKQ